MQVVAIQPTDRRLVYRFQEQQCGAERLAQIVAGGRQKARLGFIGTVGQRLGFFERQLDVEA